MSCNEMNSSTIPHGTNQGIGGGRSSTMGSGGGGGGGGGGGAKPFCVVCGRFDRNMTIRKSGLKCDPQCIGKRSVKQYATLQQQHAYFALIEQQKQQQQQQQQRTNNNSNNDSNSKFSPPGQQQLQSHPHNHYNTPSDQHQQQQQQQRSNNRPSPLSASPSPLYTNHNSPDPLTRYPTTAAAGSGSPIIHENNVVMTQNNNNSNRVGSNSNSNTPPLYSSPPPPGLHHNHHHLHQQQQHPAVVSSAGPGPPHAPMDTGGMIDGAGGNHSYYISNSSQGGSGTDRASNTNSSSNINSLNNTLTNYTGMGMDQQQQHQHQNGEQSQSRRSSTGLRENSTDSVDPSWELVNSSAAAAAGTGTPTKKQDQVSQGLLGRSGIGTSSSISNSSKNTNSSNTNNNNNRAPVFRSSSNHRSVSPAGKNNTNNSNKNGGGGGRGGASLSKRRPSFMRKRYPPVPSDARPNKRIPLKEFAAVDFDNIVVTVDASETVHYNESRHGGGGGGNGGGLVALNNTKRCNNNSNHFHTPTTLFGRSVDGGGSFGGSREGKTEKVAVYQFVVRYKKCPQNHSTKKETTKESNNSSSSSNSSTKSITSTERPPLSPQAAALAAAVVRSAKNPDNNHAAQQAQTTPTPSQSQPSTPADESTHTQKSQSMMNTSSINKRAVSFNFEKIGSSSSSSSDSGSGNTSPTKDWSRQPSSTTSTSATVTSAAEATASSSSSSSSSCDTSSSSAVAAAIISSSSAENTNFTIGSPDPKLPLMDGQRRNSDTTSSVTSSNMSTSTSRRESSIFDVLKNNEKKLGGSQKFNVAGGLSFWDAEDSSGDGEEEDEDDDDDLELCEEDDDDDVVVCDDECSSDQLILTSTTATTTNEKKKSTGSKKKRKNAEKKAESEAEEEKEKPFVPDPVLAQKLREFYMKYKPEKVAGIDDTLKTWYGRESTMFQILQRKYIDEPAERERKAAAAAAAAAEKEKQAQANKNRSSYSSGCSDDDVICVRWYRFNDCYNLFDILKTIGRDNLPDLPSKTFFRRFSGDFVEDRRKSMDKFIQAVFKDPFLIRHPSLTRVLGLKPIDRQLELAEERKQKIAAEKAALEKEHQLREAALEQKRRAIEFLQVQQQAAAAAAAQQAAVEQAAAAAAALQREKERIEEQERLNQTKIAAMSASTITQPSAENIPQDALGLWKKGSLLGKGSYGSVYLGLIPNTSQLLAVKVMMVASKETDNTNQIEQVRNELNLMKRLNHPNLVRCLGSTWDKATRELCMFQEYIECGSIARMVAKFGALPVTVIQAYLTQILQGVAYLHENNVVHRDIKGENILVTKDGVTKVADFGCAKYMQEFSKNEGNEAGGAGGGMMGDAGFDLAGTPLWMSPEAMRGEPHVDNKPSDIWSVACVGIEMLNRPIWNIREKENIYTAMFRIQKMTRLPDGFPLSDDPATPDGQLPQSFKDFLKLGLQRDANARPTAAEWLKHPFLSEDLTGRGAGARGGNIRNGDSNDQDQDCQEDDPLEDTQRVLDALPSNFFASIK